MSQVAPDHAMPESVRHLIATVGEQLSQRPKAARMFATCFPNTLQTTTTRMDDGTTFVLTGDIPAMWLRDSSAQVRPYLTLAASDATLASLLEGVSRRQIAYILRDPYANAFNREPDGHGHQDDITAMSPWVWERKYEVDSLCYPIQLAYALWKVTGRTAHLTSDFRRAVSSILALWRCEQDHEASSPYRFERLTFPFDTRETLPREGKGSPVAVTGMTWSGFRPSDDACTYGYLLPANMFAVVVLGYLAEMARSVLDDLPLHDEALRLRAEIDRGIQQHGLVEHPEFRTIYAYETDGLGHHLLMDDANVPSLLALPYLGYCRPDDPIYLNTRRFVLSVCNPYFYRGTAAEGVGSPHTPSRYIWPIALLIQGLTADNNVEKDTMLDVLERTDAGTDLMHESFSADDPRAFTRPWFAWANSLFGEFLLERCGYRLSL